MWKVSSSRPGAWLFAKVLHHVDNLLLRATRGRTSVPRLLAGLPVITLVTTGARMGRRREVPLVGVPCGENVAVIGTRFGQPDTPSWYFNLRARRAAEVSYRGRTVPVTAARPKARSVRPRGHRPARSMPVTRRTPGGFVIGRST
jgi:deazaflavin-dependent oxidoreductase (nitroreductase family)